MYNSKIFTTYQVKGLPVLQENTHKYQGKIKEVLVDKIKGKVLGLVIESKSILQGAKFLPFEHILEINKQGVITKESTILKKISLKQQKYCSEPWIGMPICSNLPQTNNLILSEDYGTMADFVWNGKTGEIVAVAVSGGIWRDLSNGWQYLDWRKIQTSDIKSNRLYIKSGIRLEDIFTN